MADNSLKTPFVQSLIGFVKKGSQDNQQVQSKSLPCHIKKVDKDFVEISFDVQGVYTLPTVKVPQNFSAYIREPTQVGDKGYVTLGDLYLGGVSGDSGGIASTYMRGNLTPLSFQPISQTKFPTRNYNQLTLTGGPEGAIMRSSDGKTSVEIHKDGSVTTSRGSGSVTIDKDGNVTVKSPKVYLGNGSYSPVVTVAGPSPTVFAES